MCLTKSFQVYTAWYFSLGYKSVDSLRDKLKEAIEAKDNVNLQKIVQESVSAGLPELDDDILKARSVLDILQGGSGG